MWETRGLKESSEDPSWRQSGIKAYQLHYAKTAHDSFGAVSSPDI